MDQTASRNELEKKLYRSFTLLSALIIVLSLGITLYFDITRQRADMDATISGTASYIASMPQVVSMLEAGYPSALAKQDIDSLCNNLPDISVVVICDSNSLRFYHTDRLKTGETFVDGDETRILQGSKPYITTGYGTKGAQRRAFHAVKSSDGTIIGFVMASVFTAHISARHRNILIVHLAIFILMMLVSTFLTHAFIRFLRKSLMGFNPHELLNMYIRQDDVMNSIEEGLIATDTDGKILFSNIVARNLFSDGPGEGPPLMGRHIRELYPDTKFDTVINTGKSVRRQTCSIGGRTILMNEIPIQGKGKKPIQGMLAIAVDRTEFLSLSDELTGTRSMLDTLRAFNHEFLNKLHVILGYLQTGEIDQAKQFIINSNLVSSQSIRETADSIRVSRICALVIGKMMHAAELGIRLTLTHDSSCIESELLLLQDSVITIIGNLLENAIEELNSSVNLNQELKEITLGIYCRPDCNIITCEDTGNGIPQELLNHIFDKGISSKGENRGTGLYLIKQITEDYQGEISIDTEMGEGTCFTLTFTRKENL
ncbi:sensor histidine kinase [[Clostridium] symbiosum]|uniref:histidine kinase n=1 Tax=[Clostridium] symbiosum ATCC 14940 TaxID=411472 RepID=A0ABC9TV23_CLOSY|nr:sensor histidine kinase [[Clostridium] symbiosum]ERI75212.1 ATPase/histidine kinase/DNA gyrase B/HSP90 domain protein [[Clostridium] symbiosum ATCC 14940]SUY60575.1 sensor histidine kinase [[Clostridium] symbiosum]